MNYRFEDEANYELERIARYINQRRPGYGDRFAVAIGRLGDRLCRVPKSYARLRNTHGREIRSAYLHRYKYTVVYQVTQNEIIFLSITHGRRNRSPWRHRMI